MDKNNKPAPESPHKHTWLSVYENGKVIGYICPCGESKPL